MRQQYGLRIQGEEFATMGWDEFHDLVAGLNEQTPLVRVAQIRTESDPERIKQLTPEQRAMRTEWQRRRALGKSDEETKAFLDQMADTFSRLFEERQQ